MERTDFDVSSTTVSLNVPGKAFVSIEHPGVVKNIQNAVATLGGDKALSKFLHSHAEDRTITLNLNPSDPLRKPIQSQHLATSDITLKITVPRMTGRKRKRGSSEAFHHEVASSLNGNSPHIRLQHLLRSATDNSASCIVEPLGVVEETHKFRALPDFQFSMATSPLVNSLKRNIVPLKYENFRKFELDTQTKGAQKRMDMIPPPVFSQMDVPFIYAYNQNPYVELITDESGKLTTLNTTAAQFTKNHVAKTSDVEIPLGPPPDLEPIEKLSPRMQHAVSELGRVFEERPIASRRYLIDRVGREYSSEIKYAVKYHAYIFQSGPWRDCLIRYGIDPRKDPGSRKYQTFMFQMQIKDDSNIWEDGRVKWSRTRKQAEQEHERTYIFDGKTLIPNAKVFQVCDITDPVLRKIIDDSSPREDFHPMQDGWFRNGTWAKVRVIMRDKIHLLLSGVQPNDSDYMRVAALPDDIEVQGPHGLQPVTMMGKREGTLAQEIMNLARFSYQGGHSKGNSMKSVGAMDLGQEEDQDMSEDDEDVEMNP